MAIYNVVLFDLDGTLTASDIGIIKSINYALSKFDILEEDIDKLESFIGPPLLESFQKHYSFNETDARRAIDFYREYFSEFGLYENRVYPGIPTLLERLKTQAKTLYVATSKPTVFSERILKHFDLYNYFTLVVGSNLDGTRSSKTEIISYILSNLPYRKKQSAIMVGDRASDVAGAHNNGIDSIAVTYGYGSIEELQTTRPTFLAHSVDELTVLLSNDVKS